MAPDDKKQLQDAGVGLDGELRVVEGGHVHCCVGLLATFYFLHGDRPEVKESVAQALDRYRKAIGDKLVWGAAPVTLTVKKIAGTDIANPRAWISRINPNEGMQVMMHGGRRKDDASAYMVVALVRSLRAAELSHFTVASPFEWLTSNPAGACPELVLDLCNILAPTHGYAGLSVIPHVDVSRDSAEFASALALAARFSGLEIDLPWSHAIYLEQEDRIKGVNWLTVLDHAWVERLGGEEKLRLALGEGIVLHAFKTGVVIQAGPRPLFGDVNRQEPMPDYRRVAKALKPIRIESVRALSSTRGFNRDRSDKWLARFD